MRDKQPALAEPWLRRGFRLYRHYSNTRRDRGPPPIRLKDKILASTLRYAGYGIAHMILAKLFSGRHLLCCHSSFLPIWAIWLVVDKLSRKFSFDLPQAATLLLLCLYHRNNIVYMVLFKNPLAIGLLLNVGRLSRCYTLGLLHTPFCSSKC